MTTAAFLAYLRRLGVELCANGDRLRLSAPKGVLTPSLRAELAERKTTILAFLREGNVAERTLVQPSSPFMRIERRPLLSLFAAGEIAPVDAAALGYLPTALLEYTGLSRDEVIHNLCDNLPVLICIMGTFLGRIAIIILPRFSSELYSDEEDIVGVIVESLEIAGRLGARTVSLMGLIPSATDYGRVITTAIAGRKDLPMISTGHATTTAVVVLVIRKILQEGGRDLGQERVGFLGLGSIGSGVLRLMLRGLPHPAEIMLCDVYSKLDLLEEIQQELVDDLGFRGYIRIIESQGEVPPEFYNATLIIGATNVPDILDIARVKPGTMIVDDSAPHCFATEQAVKRFQEQEDILFTEGGVLRSPHPISNLIYLPRPAEQLMNAIPVDVFSKHNPFEITGCIFSSLLSSRFEALKPTVGFVDSDTCFQHFEMLGQLGFQAADLRCEGYVLAEESIRNFQHRFGGAFKPP